MALASDTLFTHSPLPTPTSIRLVRRLPNDGDGLIKIALETIDLADPRKASVFHEQTTWRPGFHCLSYTWGNPYPNGVGFADTFNAHAFEYSSENLIDIWCNDKIIKIRKNLHDYLCQGPTNVLQAFRDRPDPETGKIRLHSEATGNYGIVHKNVGNGDKVNTRDLKGRTPLHYAAECGNEYVAAILLKGGAIVDAQDADGRTPQDLALGGSHYSVWMLLEGVRIGNSETMNFVESVPPFDRDTSDDYIWIDALCIDQDNLEERQLQVQMMDQIYAASNYIVVWLGNDDGYIDGAISTMSKLASAGTAYVESKLVPYRSHSPEEYESLGMPYISDDEWKALAALFLRQWFRRIWVIQEAVLAFATIVYCGKSKVEWGAIEYTAWIMDQKADKLGHRPSTVYVPTNEVGVGIEYYFWQIRKLLVQARDLKESYQPGAATMFALENLILTAVPFRATDPRDKIYALAPLAKLCPVQVSVQPDYKMPPAQCYANFTRIQLAKNGLEMLSWVQDASTRVIDGLPSWVPDFSLSGIIPLYHRSFSSSGDFNLAKGGLSAHKEWYELCMKGIPWENVVQTADPRPIGGRNQKFELDASWFDLLANVKQTSQNIAPRMSVGEILWRTLCADIDHDGQTPAPDAYGLMFKKFLCALICAQPEINIREEERKREDSIMFFGLTSTVLSLQNRELVDSGPHGPDVVAMEKLRERMPPPARNTESKYFDCVRPVLHKLQALTAKFQEPYLPTVEDLDQYLLEAVDPIRDASGTKIPAEIRPFASAHDYAYGRRRLFLTKSGHLGLGPASLQTGDSVWLLPGFRVPVVLRTAAQDRVPEGRLREGCFQFVGAAYVHGIMHGEASTHFNTNDIREVVIV